MYITTERRGCISLITIKMQSHYGKHINLCIEIQAYIREIHTHLSLYVGNPLRGIVRFDIQENQKNVTK